ncbi:hypothetical protein AMELA_G00037310 [Ameiurus melas]|uniref:Uncharacterized protein n=1 Tax=Ameiurus melas TaxID=219545 RepID=A0A7J6B8T4_AMEME|nr:hypothetical protein AMELA_G00037310 [Ameiurus melas]
MRDLSTHTRLTPEQRENRLNRFINNMSRCWGDKVRRIFNEIMKQGTILARNGERFPSLSGDSSDSTFP